MANFGDADGVGGSSVGTGKTASQASLAKSDRGDPAVAILRETARQEGYRAGFETGRADGLKAGQQAADGAARELSEQMAKAISGFDAGVAEIERVLADEVLALSLEIARKVIGQAITVQPEVVLGTIRAALAQLPAHQAVIHLNAEDVALLRKHSEEQLSRAGHRIQEDPQLARGDVIIDSGGAHIDSKLSTRWQRVIATLDQDTPWVIPAESERS
jgi:flagellar assembly protein FliH